MEFSNLAIQPSVQMCAHHSGPGFLEATLVIARSPSWDQHPVTSGGGHRAGKDAPGVIEDPQSLSL